MINVKDLGLNTICPVCGEKVELIDAHINSLNGVVRIQGRCLHCNSYFEVSESNGQDLDIKTKWNRIMKEGNHGNKQ